MKFPLGMKAPRVPIRKVIFLTTVGASTLLLPADFTSIGSKVQCWGPGAGSGWSANTNPGAGGGGGYSEQDDLPWTAGSTINFNVPAGGLGGVAAGVPAAPGDTWIGGTSLATSNCGAKGGLGGNSAGGAGGLGGQASAGVGSLKFSGGQGGTGSGGGAGGGGAAGPFGDGAPGGSNPGPGGQGDAGHGGLGGVLSTSGSTPTPGQPGTECGTAPNTYGGGGGGGGRNNIVTVKGSSGGLYGGGGGSPRTTANAPGGDGAQGLIVLSYWGYALPVTSGSQDFNAGAGTVTFRVPEYNTMTWYLFGPGASGTSTAAGFVAGQAGTDSTIAQLGMTAGSGQPGATGSAGAGGVGGTATGGDSNIAGNPGDGGNTNGVSTTGKGGDAPRADKGGGLGGTRPGTVNTAGRPGNAYGGGGSTGQTSAWGSGGGSGSCCIKTVNRTDPGAPAPGTLMTIVIGAGGPSSASTYLGGKGADGGARVEWA